MQLKYLKFDVAVKGKPREPVVIAFSNALTHKNIADRIKVAISNEFNTADITVANGGFIVFSEAIINGRSDSCEVESNKDDVDLFTI